MMARHGLVTLMTRTFSRDVDSNPFVEGEVILFAVHIMPVELVRGGRQLSAPAVFRVPARRFDGHLVQWSCTLQLLSGTAVFGAVGNHSSPLYEI